MFTKPFYKKNKIKKNMKGKYMRRIWNRRNQNQEFKNRQNYNFCKDWEWLTFWPCKNVWLIQLKQNFNYKCIKFDNQISLNVCQSCNLIYQYAFIFEEHIINF